MRALKAFLFGLLLIANTYTAAVDIAVVNPGFEDISGQTVFNEFTFGVPVGWDLYDPDLVSGPGVFTGTLNNPDVTFFNEPAPDGTRVAILFNEEQQGNGVYGFQQTLSETLQPNTVYELRVEVGNIQSGYAINGSYFDLSGFPGYSVELLADINPLTIGDEMPIAVDDNSLYGLIDEGYFETSVVTASIGASHAYLGELLAIRLTNYNEIPIGINPIPDLEVDFDSVQLTAEPDNDGDGIPDIADWDDDNDGVPDAVDAEPLNDGNATEINLPLDSIYQGNRQRKLGSN